jgi:hypothetical protein
MESKVFFDLITAIRYAMDNSSASVPRIYLFCSLYSPRIYLVTTTKKQEKNYYNYVATIVWQP